MNRRGLRVRNTRPCNNGGLRANAFWKSDLEREREMEERKREVRFIVAGRLKRVVGDADEFIDATRRLELCELGEPRFTFAFCTKILLRLRASPGLFQGTTAPGGRSTEESSEGRLAFNRRVVATHCYSRLLLYLDSDKLPNFRHGLLFPSLLWFGIFFFFLDRKKGIYRRNVLKLTQGLN